MFKRVFLLVLDGLGVGSCNDEDKGANTLLHILGDNGDYNLNVLEMFGLTRLVGIENENTKGLFLRCKPKTKNKDSLNGHYEMMCTSPKIKFQTYPEGFPLELITEIKEVTGKDVIGNIACSGTEIINELGEMHMNTGAIIIYTSADSILQVAAHEDIISIEELYDICEKIKGLVVNDKYGVARVVARPFTGKPGEFVRLPKRKDFTIDPPINVLDLLDRKGFKTICIGKIGDMFNNRGISSSIKTKDNIETMIKVVDFSKNDFEGLLFANFNDFDSSYGHRRDKEGYLKALEEFNYYLPILLKNMKKDDLLIITGDHGNDPTYKGSDHTREYIPVLVFNSKFKHGMLLEDRDTFADIGATILDNFNIDNTTGCGKSIFDSLRN